MLKNIEKTITFYCDNELEAFKKSRYFIEIKNLVNNLGLLLECSYGEDCSHKRHPKNIYLGIAVLNKQGEIVVVDLIDDEHLCDATNIVSIDRKGRVSFFPWEDIDFIESLEWIIKELKKGSMSNVGVGVV